MRPTDIFRRPVWRLLAPLTLAALTALVAYAIWSPGLDLRDGRHDRGRNAIWLSHAWLGADDWFRNSGREADAGRCRSAAEIRRLADRLRAHNFTDLFPHLCPADAEGSIAASDPEQVERFLDGLPGFRVMPWIGGARGSSAFPERKAWRARFVRSATELLRRHPRLAGVHVNVEPCRSGAQDFLLLLEELHAALPRGKVLSVAAYPPPTRWHPHPDVHWDEAYYRDVSERCDQIAVMMYDTALRWRKPYQRLVAGWTREVLDWGEPTPVLLGLPAYDDAGSGYHHPRVENLAVALAGVHRGLVSEGPLPANYQGTAVYSAWEMDEGEWRTYRRNFVDPARTRPGPGTLSARARVRAPVPPPPAGARDGARLTVHVFVPLCDNRNQGVVKVVASLGNGQDPTGNLYWGARYGVRTFLARSEDWEQLRGVRRPAEREILDRAAFRRRGGGREVLLVADAYDGAHMRLALTHFFAAAAGRRRDEAVWRDGRAGVARDADMVAFTGHNGLMDLRLDGFPRRAGTTGPDCAVVLACRSRDYFAEPLRLAGCRPLVTTSGLMAPEAYTLDAIVRSWAQGDTPPETRAAAAAAYSRYQKCPRTSALRLFVAGEAVTPGRARH